MTPPTGFTERIIRAVFIEDGIHNIAIDAEYANQEIVKIEITGWMAREEFFKMLKMEINNG